MRGGRQTSSPPWRRHDLLHVAPDVWASALVHCPSLADLPLLGVRFDYPNGRELPDLVRRYALQKLEGLPPQDVSRYLPPVRPSHAEFGHFNSGA